MSRQNMYPNPASKHMDAYVSFNRGINVSDPREKIQENEVTDVVNFDLGLRGSIEKRPGLKEYVVVQGSTKGQGFFRYFKEGGEYDEIVAADGKLYINGLEREIEGLEEGFQTEKLIDATQYRDKMYIATGTKLCVYDGDNVSVVDPYMPKPLEALYIGTNALADDPFSYIVDGEANDLRIDGPQFSQRYGIINEPFEIKVFISKPSDMEVMYSMESRTDTMMEGFWEPFTDEDGNEWQSSKTFEFTPTYEGNMQFRLWAIPKDKLPKSEGGTAPDEEDDGKKWMFFRKQALVPVYRIKPVADPDDEPIPVGAMHTCTNIILHWERIIMYGNEDEPDAMYISHAKNPSYFPMVNNLVFENKERERIVNIIRYRDNLVIFTPNSVQALYGKGPHEYQRVMLNSDVGCIAKNSVAVTTNHITFLSYNGVYVLRSLGYTEDKANVHKIDTRIHRLIEEIEIKENACAVFHDNVYHLTFPEVKQTFKYSTDLDGWARNESEHLDFIGMFKIRDTVYVQHTNGSVSFFDENTFTDLGKKFRAFLSTKNYDYGEPFNPKKLRQVQLVIGSSNQKTSVYINVFADAANVLNTNTSYAKVNDDGVVEWVERDEPNLQLKHGTSLGSWEMGFSPFGEVDTMIYKQRVSAKCNRVRLELGHEDDTPLSLHAVGWVFKTKKP